MVLLAVLAYVFEECLYDLTYRPDTFVYVISILIMLALFFLFCYRTPSVGLRILGRYTDYKIKNVGGVTYNIFQSSSPIEEKLLLTRRKQARNLRKQYARTTREMDAEKTAEKTTKKTAEKNAATAED